MLENWNDLSPGKLIILAIIGAIVIRMILDILKEDPTSKPKE